MKLKFLGSGSAFNSTLGNTSAYIKQNNDELILIDCGGNIYERIMAGDILNDSIKYVNIFITHTHPDHCGSLGDVIFYCYYKLGIKINVFCVDSNITKILEYQGCGEEFYFYYQLTPYQFFWG